MVLNVNNHSTQLIDGEILYLCHSLLELNGASVSCFATSERSLTDRLGKFAFIFYVVYGRCSFIVWYSHIGVA